MDLLPLLNFFSKHASELGSNVWPLKGRIPSRSSPDVTNAFAAALDTLATLCVSKQTGQKVAMSVTLPPDSTTRVIITLSESKFGMEDTAEFLQQLWGALNSLQHNPTDGVEKRNDVLAITFRHGLQRLRQRISSLWMDAMKFHAYWEASTTKRGDESIHGRLVAVFNILRVILDSLPSTGTPTQAQTVDIVTQMHALYEHCEALSNAEATVQQWLNEYAHASGEPAIFPLRRYLKGILALYIKTVSLIDAATHTDSDLHDMFARTLHIKTLQPEISPLDYPLDKPFWESYLADIVDRCEITGTNTPKLRRALDEEVTHAIATAKEMKYAPLHCELRLLIHHQQQLHASPPENDSEGKAETATPPQNYIGTSEPPCYACGVFMDAYRRKSRDVFSPMYTQVPNPALQVPWAMPKLGNAEVDRAIQRTVFIQFCLDYAEFIGHQFGFHRLPHSDDTVLKWQW